MPSVLNTTRLRSQRSNYLETLEQGFSSADLQSVNISAHARRYWPVQFTWMYLLERLTAIKGDTISVPELWELRMITDAGQHPKFNPVACHPWSGHPDAQATGTTLYRLQRVFAGYCARLMIDRGSAVTRKYYLQRLRGLSERITNLCDAAMLKYEDSLL